VTSLGRYGGLAGIEQDAPPPQSLQPRIFSHKIPSISAVARSLHFLRLSEDPKARLRRARQHSVPDMDVNRRRGQSMEALVVTL
jgi:hypothetical protein